MVLLVVGAGVAAFIALRPGEPLGTAERGPAVTPDSPPDQAFDLLLPTLKRWTDAPIMLPVELPNGMENVAIDADLDGDSYGILFEDTPPDEMVDTFVRYRTVATLRVIPEAALEPNEQFKTVSTEAIELPDGTEAILSRMEPVGERPTQGPYWEGTFERGGFAYTLTVTSEALAKANVEQALSTMVQVRGAVGGPATEGTTEPTTTVAENLPSASSSTSPGGFTVPYSEEAARAEAEVEQATRDYYEAVDREDWDYTYENLDSETREMFTEEEWYEKNQWFADHENLELEAIEVDAVMNFGGKEADVTVRRTFEDGTSLTRRTYFVYEDGEWRHRFTDEEKGVFMPDASYEEFVAAQQ